MHWSLSSPSIRKGLAALGALAALASCGGGGQVVPFEPDRIVALGDELSVLEADGRKWSINAFAKKPAPNETEDDPTTLDCTRNPIWIQTVAAGFGLAFERCLGSETSGTGQVLAQPGAKVADLPAQLAALQGAALNDKDLVLVMVGMHDILELYAGYPTTSRSTLLDQARARGEALGQRVNALAQSGPAVVVLTAHDVGLSPYAKAQNTSTADPTRAALLSDLTSAFNNRMSVTLINDGRLIGLVYADIESQNMAKFPASFSLSNVLDAACSVAPPDCKPDTLVSGATSTSHLWADSLRPGPAAQSRLGAVASFRARNNPF
jgi:outer membrane lipase/esterase